MGGGRSHSTTPEQSLDIPQISALSNEVRHARNAIRDWLRVELGLDRGGRELNTPERLDADGFASVVRPALPKRRSLSAAEVARLKREHADTIVSARHAAAEMKRLEKRVSDLVNQAYGLTAEEIALMWSTAPPRIALAFPLPQQTVWKPFVDAHARDELGLTDALRARPLQAAFTSAASFSAIAIMPLLISAFVSTIRLMPLVAVTSLLFLVLLGGMAARGGGAPLRPAAIRVVFWSALAMSVTAGWARSSAPLTDRNRGGPTR